jgi:UDP-N-acetylglucosamine--N-acetylmuramyl-(pentapeptide) pyrophosphoryl-undecaprenol N-acetylglucosamine transferase
MKLTVASGGTGGHVNPGIGIAEEAQASGLVESVDFIGARYGLEKELVSGAGFPISLLPVDRVRGMGPMTKAAGLAGLALAVPMAMRLLQKSRTDVVAGMGGYASAPALLAAAAMGIPTVLCEQNTIPGSTNRILAQTARRICVSFPMTSGYLPSWKVVVTGNPVRRTMAAARTRRSSRRCDSSFRILVLGGSQGALFLNQTVAAALSRFAASTDDVVITHQTGKGRQDEARSVYGDLNGRIVLKEYIEDMAGLLSDVDLVVARSGATTIAELTAVGVPAILVPFPYATDNHQYWNAATMVNAGAGLMFEQKDYTEASFLASIRHLHEDRSQLQHMEESARSLGSIDAARRVVRILQEIGGQQ